MKAVGLNIVLAQAGMFVSNDKMVYKPYNKIFSRIGNQDNIFTGKSSFTQEMAELRDIIKRVDENSLVIGDELCSGTEAISAVSLVSAGLINLSNIKCSFIFATHLHKLKNIPYIEKIENIHKYYLEIRYDYEQKCLIYDRELKKGYGNEEYGLEIAKSLDMDSTFLGDAIKIRNYIVDETEYKQSIYNSDKFLGKCEICNDKADDIHHIKFQSSADTNGYIGNMHKNKKCNLCALCSSCHTKVHNNTIYIDGYIHSSNGITLKYSK